MLAFKFDYFPISLYFILYTSIKEEQYSLKKAIAFKPS